MNNLVTYNVCNSEGRLCIVPLDCIHVLACDLDLQFKTEYLWARKFTRILYPKETNIGQSFAATIGQTKVIVGNCANSIKMCMWR